jgi:hypothetical protein
MRYQRSDLGRARITQRDGDRTTRRVESTQGGWIRELSSR